MPFGSPTLVIRLLQYDEGDEKENDITLDQMMDYLTSRLISFEFSDHSRKKDQAKLTFRNEDYAMFDRPVFVRGQKLLMTWGWPGRTAPPRRMIVKSVRGGEEITVTCHCVLSLMDSEKQGRFMAGVTDSEWVRTIADLYHYTGPLAHIEQTYERHDITQPRYTTDARMLRVLAKRNGFQFFIDANGLHWLKQPNDREPVRNFIYRRDPKVGDLLSPPKFDANLSKGVARVRVKSRDPILKVNIDQSIGIDDEQDVSLGVEDELFDPAVDTDVGRRGARVGEEEIVSGAMLTEAEAKARAGGRYRETAQKRYKVELSIIGDPLVQAKQIVGLWGDVSQTMAGLYYVNEATTKIAPGEFTMNLRCRKDALKEVTAAKKRRPRANVNKKATTEEPPAEETKELEQIYTLVTLPSGELVPGVMWTDDGGKTGQTSPFDPGDFEKLPDYEKEQFRYEMEAVSYPDQ